MKIVINKGHGGFCLSTKAMKKLFESINFEIFGYSDDGSENRTVNRRYHDDDMHVYWSTTDLGDNPTNDELMSAKLMDADDFSRSNLWLIDVIEEFGESAEGPYCDFKIVDIPDDVEWEIQSCEGIEWVAEKHRTWK